MQKHYQPCLRHHFIPQCYYSTLPGEVQRNEPVATAPRAQKQTQGVLLPQIVPGRSKRARGGYPVTASSALSHAAADCSLGTDTGYGCRLLVLVRRRRLRGFATAAVGEAAVAVGEAAAGVADATVADATVADAATGWLGSADRNPGSHSLTDEGADKKKGDGKWRKTGQRTATAVNPTGSIRRINDTEYEVLSKNDTPYNMISYHMARLAYERSPPFRSSRYRCLSRRVFASIHNTTKLENECSKGKW